MYIDIVSFKNNNIHFLEAQGQQKNFCVTDEEIQSSWNAWVKNTKEILISFFYLDLVEDELLRGVSRMIIIIRGGKKEEECELNNTNRNFLN